MARSVAANRAHINSQAGTTNPLTRVQDMPSPLAHPHPPGAPARAPHCSGQWCHASVRSATGRFAGARGCHHPVGVQGNGFPWAEAGAQCPQTGALVGPSVGMEGRMRGIKGIPRWRMYITRRLLPTCRHATDVRHPTSVCAAERQASVSTLPRENEGKTGNRITSASSADSIIWAYPPNSVSSAANVVSSRASSSSTCAGLITSGGATRTAWIWPGIPAG